MIICYTIQGNLGGFMKLNVKQNYFCSLAFLIISMFWQVYDNIIAKMLIEAFGFNQVWSGVILAWIMFSLIPTSIIMEKFQMVPRQSLEKEPLT
jgi:hypothetical protein